MEQEKYGKKDEKVEKYGKKMEQEKYGLKCVHCKEVVYSEYRNDFKRCKCGKIFVDGGNDYFRYGGELEDYEIISRSDHD